MQPVPLLNELAVILAVAVGVTVILGRLRLPAVAGLLLSGALVGPHGLGWVANRHAIENIAEMGVVLLLFSIGLELSLNQLRHIFRNVALGGLLQVVGTATVVWASARLFGRSNQEAVFYGFVFALSSTAVVLRMLTERREVDAPHGRFIVGTLILQDLCVIPMVLLVPLLGQHAMHSDAYAGIALALIKALGLMFGVFAIARLAVPKLLDWVDAHASREVFLLAVLAVCASTAWLSSLVGLSLALGAFLGGLMVADTQYSHRAMGDLLPLRDVFVSIFFVTLGMFFDLGVVINHPTLVALLMMGFIFGKGMLATVAALVMRFPPRAAWLAGVGLAQFGEFGFVLIRLGTKAGVVNTEQTAPLLCAGIASMFLTPLMVYRAPHITAGERLLQPLAKLLGARSIDEDDALQPDPEQHVVLIGYGLAGKMVARSLKNLGIGHIILELNASNVREGQLNGDPVRYADATSLEALGHAHIEQAKAAVILINDPQATTRVVQTIRSVTPQLPIFVRTHYLREAEDLMGHGATDVVAEELEGGAEILARMLRAFALDPAQVHAELHAFHQLTLRTSSAAPKRP